MTNKNDLLAIAVAVGVSGGAFLLYVYCTSDGWSKAKVKKKLRGIQNLGTTCFANALLQSLASCSSFVEWFAKMSTEPSSHDLILLRALNSLAFDLNSADVGEISAGGIINALRARGWIVRTDVEQDLYELLNVFITTWEEEIVSFMNANEKITSLIDVKRLNEDETTNLRGPNFLKPLSDLKEVQSYLRSPCTGLLATQFHCRSCGHKTLTLEHCIRKYFAIEKLYNVTCESCNEKSGNPAVGRSEFYKRQGLSKLPDCLIIRIERMAWLPSGVCFKQNDFVEFGEILDVRDFVFYRTKEMDYDMGVVGGKALVQPVVAPAKDPFSHLRVLAQSNYGLQQGAIVSGASVNVVEAAAKNVINLRYKYRLNAVAVHQGDEVSGHFVTYRRGPPPDTNSWYLTSDSDVKKVDFAAVSRCQAYMLFYERVSQT